jgi:endonuclease/exonuclease/phosphatase family metal-dependent hydrolase
MDAIGRRLPELEANVFAFQEVWTADARARLVDAGRRSGHIHVWHRRATRGGGGILVLSRHPVRSAQFTRFALGGLPQRVHHADYYAGKGVVRVTLATPAGPLCVAVTHLNASYGRHGIEDEYRGHRCAQVIEVAWALRNVEAPVVLGGDLNAYETDPEVRILLGLAGLTDVAAALDRRQETVVPFSPYRPNENPPGPRIDYVLSRSGRARGLQPRDIERVLDEEFEVEGRRATYSDHTGLRAVFEVDDHGAPAPPPLAEAVALARDLLEEGRERTRVRRDAQRVLAGGAGLSVLALLAAARGVGTSRRGALRAGLYAAGGLGLLGAGGLAALSEGFTPSAVRGYHRAEQQLAALSGPTRS